MEILSFLQEYFLKIAAVTVSEKKDEWWQLGNKILVLLLLLLLLLLLRQIYIIYLPSTVDIQPQIFKIIVWRRFKWNIQLYTSVLNVHITQLWDILWLCKSWYDN